MGAAYSTDAPAPPRHFQRLLHRYVLDLLTFHACCRLDPDREPPCLGTLDATEGDLAALGRRVDDQCLQGFCEALRRFLQSLRHAAELGTVCAAASERKFAGESAGMLARLERVRDVYLGNALQHGRSLYIQAQRAGRAVRATEGDWMRDVDAFLDCFRAALHTLDESTVSVKDFEALLSSHGCVKRIGVLGVLLDGAAA